jgi:hypothetical protein
VFFKPARKFAKSTRVRARLRFLPPKEANELPFPCGNLLCDHESIMWFIYGLIWGKICSAGIQHVVKSVYPQGASSHATAPAASAINDDEYTPAQERALRLKLAAHLSGYLAIAQHFVMHRFDKQAWENALPGQTVGFAKFTIWSFVLRILPAYVVASIVAPLSKLLASPRHWSIATTEWRVFVAVMLIMAIAGPFRWLPSWLFAPFSMVYSWKRYRTLMVSGESSVVPIAMNSYSLLLSYGAVAGAAAAWMTGQHGKSIYSVIVICSCTFVFTLLAAMILRFVPDRLFSEGRYSLLYPNEPLTPDSIESIPGQTMKKKQWSNSEISQYRKAFIDDLDHKAMLLRQQSPDDSSFTHCYLELSRLENDLSLLCWTGEFVEHDVRREVLTARIAHLSAKIHARKGGRDEDSDRHSFDTRDDVLTAAAVANNPADIPIFRWETAFPTIEGRPDTIEPKLLKTEDGSFRFDSFLPLKPPTE